MVITTKVASGKIQWFKGQIRKYDGLIGKYGIYFHLILKLYVFIYKRQGHKDYLLTVL